VCTTPGGRLDKTFLHSLRLLLIIFNLIVEPRRRPELDRVFSGLADPTRHAILRALVRRPATINEIARPFPVSLNAISKHVMVLERAGLIRREIWGREHHCRIAARPLRDAKR
jgi:DNA-binding transcriptional ArsR family regulator